MATEEDGEGEEKECSGPVEAEGPVAPEEQEAPALGHPALVGDNLGTSIQTTAMTTELP